MAAQLGLVKSFDPATYPYYIKINTGFSPTTCNADVMFQDAYGYAEYKDMIGPGLKSVQVRSILEKGGVDDYCLYQSGISLNLYFKTEIDFSICIAGLDPDNKYSIDFITYPEETSKKSMKKDIRSWRTVFNESGLPDRIRFKIDDERKVVRLSVQNGHDYVAMYGIIRDLEHLAKKPILDKESPVLQVFLG